MRPIPVFADKKVLVTGGSSGIGLAAAVQLAASGASVVVVARDDARLQSAVAAMRAVAPSQSQVFEGLSVDVMDDDAVAALPDAVLSRLGALDLLICNAGYALPAYVSESPMAAFQRMLDVNYLGHVRVVKAFLPHFLERRQGHISLVSSMLGFMSAFGYAAYSGSKYAIAGFAEALRHELKPHGVAVSLYYPPTTETPGLSEENRTKPQAVWAFESESGWNKLYKPEAVADSLLRHIQSGRYEGMIGWDSWLIFLAYRWFPTIARKMADDELKRALAKTSGQR